jgi:hypothetical protein
MGRGLLTLIALTSSLLVLSAPAALAQDAVDPFDDPAEPEVTATATPEEPTPDAPEPDGPGCERVGTGPDSYCLDLCDFQGDDADYTYYGPECVEANAGGGGPPPERRERPASAVRPLAAQQLPLTGGEPWLIAACGAGFVMAGSGLRLRARPR